MNVPLVISMIGNLVMVCLLAWAAGALMRAQERCEEREDANDALLARIKELRGL